MTFRVWDSEIGLQTKELVQECEVRCLQTCGEDRKVALGLENGTVRVLDIATLSILFEDKGAHQDVVRSICFSLRSPFFVTTSYDKTSRVLNTDTWEEASDPLLLHSNRGAGCAFSPGGRTLIFFSSGGTFVCDVESGSSVEISREVTAYMRCAAFSLNGMNIVCGSYDGVVRVFGRHIAENPEKTAQRNRGYAFDICLLNDGGTLAAAMRDGTIRFYDTESGLPTSQELKGRTDSVRCIALSLDRRQMISGSCDRTLRLWDLESFRQIGGPFDGHSGYVSCVSFGHDGLRIISGYSNGTAQIWNAFTGQKIGAILQLFNIGIDAVAESSDECHIVHIAAEGVRIWSLKREQVVWGSEYRMSGISSNEAEEIIYKCGTRSARFWTSSFPPHPDGIMCNSQRVYFSGGGDRELLACLPSVRRPPEWDYSTKKNVFAAALLSGRLAVCKLVLE